MALEPLIERVGWWAEIFETPCVAYAASIEAAAPACARRGGFRRARRSDLERGFTRRGGPRGAGTARGFRGRAAMTRLALALALVLALSGAASAQTPAPNVNVASPLLNLSGFGARDAPPSALPPRADGKPPDMAFGAYQRGNFLAALKEAELRIDANSKDAAAMTLIGQIYHDGAAVGRDEVEASRWWRLASNLGDPQAAYELGALLLAGSQGRAEGSRRREGPVRAGGGKGARGRDLQSRRHGARQQQRTQARLHRGGARLLARGESRRRQRRLFLRRHGARGQGRSPGHRRGRALAQARRRRPASSPARSNMRSCCSTAKAWRRTKPARSRFF